MNENGSMIQTDDLWKTYQMGVDNEIHALRGITFEVERNEYMAIMGPSGSGKSTLMNLIGCLDTPSRGQYRLNGRLVSFRLYLLRRRGLRYLDPSLCPVFFLIYLHVALDVNLPAGQLGRQSRVLTFLADCKREVALRYDGASGFGFLVYVHT